MAERVTKPMTSLQRLQRMRQAWAADLVSAQRHRTEVITQMNVADAQIQAAQTALERVDRAIADEEAANEAAT